MVLSTELYTINKRGKMTNHKKIVMLALIILGVSMIPICFAAGRGALVGLWDIPAKLNWKEKTSSLDSAVAKDLCMAFSLPPEDFRCKPDSIVYAPDFFSVIKETFAPKNDAWATYEEVQEKLGKYQYDYEPPVTTGDGLTYFRAWYDLRGDRVYPIVMFFYGDGRLWRLIADVGD
jgi:hypothetical protein